MPTLSAAHQVTCDRVRGGSDVGSRFTLAPAMRREAPDHHLQWHNARAGGPVTLRTASSHKGGSATAGRPVFLSGFSANLRLGK